MMSFAAVALVIAALATACSGAATTVPRPGPTQTSGPEPPTLMPTQEWSVKDIKTSGDTVIVSLHVFAGIAVRVTLDGEMADRVDQNIPTLSFVFEDVAPGEHTVEIKDVVGLSETKSVTVEAPPLVDGDIPLWLGESIEDLGTGNVEYPPISITKYQWAGETVYYVVKQCCDQFRDLLDSEAN